MMKWTHLWNTYVFIQFAVTHSNILTHLALLPKMICLYACLLTVQWVPSKSKERKRKYFIASRFIEQFGHSHNDGGRLKDYQRSQKELSGNGSIFQSQSGSDGTAAGCSRWRRFMSSLLLEAIKPSHSLARFRDAPSLDTHFTFNLSREATQLMRGIANLVEVRTATDWLLSVALCLFRCRGKPFF